MKPYSLEELAAAMGARAIGQAGACTVTGVSTDSREVRRGDLFFAIRGDRYDGHRFVTNAIDSGAMAAVVSDLDRVPRDLHDAGLLLLVDDTTAALNRLAAFHRRQVRAAVIGITGSNGKTTTKEMVHQVLKVRLRGRAAPKSFNNNIGVPLTLLSVEPDDDYVVAEIGSNAPGEVSQLAAIASPDVGVITSVGETHLERLKTLAGVAVEKSSLVEHVREGGCAVINGESDLLVDAVRRRRARPERIVRFGRSGDVELRATDLESGPDHVRFRVNGSLPVNLPIPGPHNALNALAALAVGRELGIEMAGGAAQLARFTAPSMRLETHRYGRLTLINDAYNANPASMAAALDVLRSWPIGYRRFFVAGQMRELGEASPAKHEELGRQVTAAGIEVFLAVGEMADVTAEAARRSGRFTQVETAANPADAVAVLKRVVRPDDVILIKGSRAEGLEALVPTIRELGETMPADPGTGT